MYQWGGGRFGAAPEASDGLAKEFQAIQAQRFLLGEHANKADQHAAFHCSSLFSHFAPGFARDGGNLLTTLDGDGKGSKSRAAFSAAHGHFAVAANEGDGIDDHDAQAVVERLRPGHEQR